MSTYSGYKRNINLPKAEYIHNFTQKEKDEFNKCIDDPLYFAETYMKIISIDHGLVPFKMWDFQRDMVNLYYKNRFAICMCPRQVGKTTTSVAYLLHYILFNENVAV